MARRLYDSFPGVAGGPELVAYGPAIETRYLGPTDYRGGRIRARWADRDDFGGWRRTTKTIGYPHEANMGASAHWRAAVALLAATPLTELPDDGAGRWIATSTDTGYLFVRIGGAE